MKKGYLLFLILLVGFSYCYSQNIRGYSDTIVTLRGDKKIVCKIVLSDKSAIYYKTASDTDKIRKMELWRIGYIYENLQKKIINAPVVKQAAAANPADTTPQLLFGNVNASFEFPSGNLPSIANGGHLDITAEYFFMRQTAVAVRAGVDLLTTQSYNDYLQDNYFIQQYMGGLMYRLGNATKVSNRNPVPGAPWVDFIGMGGLIVGQDPKLYGYVQGSNGIIATGSISAGTGYGLGGYAAIQISIITRKQKIFTFGIGYLYTTLRYNNYTYNLQGIPGSVISGQSFSVTEPTKFNLGLFQPYVGVGF
jgi:hypothetical protein